MLLLFSNEYTFFLLRQQMMDQQNEQINIYEQDIQILKEQVKLLSASFLAARCKTVKQQICVAVICNG